MRIGINTLAVNRGDFGGGERYLYFLLRHLAKIDGENEYFIFVNFQNQDRFTVKQENFQPVMCHVDASRVKRILYEQFVLPELLRKYRIDVFHSPNNVLPFRTKCKSVVTIQYMFSFLMPEDYTPFCRRWYFNTLMKLSAQKAHRVISVSHDNKQQIIRYLGIPESKITTIYHGLDESFMRVKDLNSIEAAKAKYGINSDYILCVANNVLNKNLEGLIKAFRYLKERYDIPHKLVIVGNTGFSRKRQAWLRDMKKKNPDVIHTGYVDYKKVPCLYWGAAVFVLPSYCESFGIPLLEAMACGVPVVTSNIFAMPEVIGDAGLKVDPYDFREIGEAIHSLLSNQNLRKELIDKGFKRIEGFSWGKAAIETLALYEEVYKS